MSENDGWFSTGEYAFNGVCGPSIQLCLRRYGGERGIDVNGRRAVLLLHGASANHNTFTFNARKSLADRLLGEGFDPWLLDWRGSSLVVKRNANALQDPDRSTAFTLSHAAEEDLRAALIRMRDLYRVRGPISLLGHCMGSAVIAEAVALGHLQMPGMKVDRVVLLALGLFYEAPIDSRLKSEERLLERLLSSDSSTVVGVIDPDVEAVEVAGRAGDNSAAANDVSEVRLRWPAPIVDLYRSWPLALRSHPDDPADSPQAFCNRLAFMYGLPYYEPNLPPALHALASSLKDQFGGIPSHLYLHCARNLRRGQAIIATPDRAGAPVISDEARNRFLALDRVTLITGALNRLWHRDSIDRMYEWLVRGSSANRRRVHKHIFENYAHQDLLWGQDAPADIYPTIVEALGGELTPVGR